MMTWNVARMWKTNAYRIFYTNPLGKEHSVFTFRTETRIAKNGALLLKFGFHRAFSQNRILDFKFSLRVQVTYSKYK
jgi:hypothetical protein